MTTVIKLGGSVITEKDTPETVDDAALERAAGALAGASDRLVVVHGGGSFGHHHAAAYGVSTTAGTNDDVAVREIHGAMKRLNAAVIEALADVGVLAVPVHPLSAAHRRVDGALRFPEGTVEAMLDEGFVPVLHGDVIVHESEGATILSGDELVVSLAAALSADRVGVCSAVSGVYDTDGDVIDHIGSFDDVAAAVGESDETDVTGGMAGKVRTLLSLDAPASVFGIDGLGTFVDGGEPGTRID
jgi:isopentenyl phosphate kinase